MDGTNNQNNNNNDNNNCNILTTMFTSLKDLPQKYHIKLYIAIIVGLISILSGAYQAINEVIENINMMDKNINIIGERLQHFIQITDERFKIADERYMIQNEKLEVLMQKILNDKYERRFKSVSNFDDKLNLHRTVLKADLDNKLNLLKTDLGEVYEILAHFEVSKFQGSYYTLKFEIINGLFEKPNTIDNNQAPFNMALDVDFLWKSIKPYITIKLEEIEL
ncbi:hypothetical protein RhiirA5_419599 [Rhizophagus irregularis]|uniref:Uncharacterized protein n=1 Tax=Rhizophagus irregularis TaxID=588596 RepID=A0A2N0PHW2_9GLOM|nr:hypothetical protein RhiirA5_419599 [Rhizophagus irregularis]